MKAVLRREMRRIVTRALEPLLLVVLPVLALGFTWAIFSAGLPRELRAAVVDQDHSRLSRQLARMIDATPTVRVSERPADPKAAAELILAGRVYAYVLLPEGLERSVKRGQAEPVVAYTNAQLLVPGEPRAARPPSTSPQGVSGTGGSGTPAAKGGRTSVTSNVPLMSAQLGSDTSGAE